MNAEVKVDGVLKKDDHQWAIEAFKARLEARQTELGVKILSATGVVKMDPLHGRRVWVGCPRHNPRRDLRRMYTQALGGRMSGRQWVKARKRMQRMAKVIMAQKAAEKPQDPPMQGDIIEGG